MSREKLDGVKALAYAAAIAVYNSTLFISLNCTGTPIEAPPSSWKKVAEAPPGAASIFASDDTHVWLVGGEDGEAVIWRWDGETLGDEFRCVEKNTDLRDIDFYGATGWAAGYVGAAGERSGLLLRYEGGSWSRVSNVPASRFGFSKVSAFASDGCWVIGGSDVLRYDGGTWTRFVDFPNARDIGFCKPSRGFITTDLGPYIWVFDGEGWVRENVTSPSGLAATGLAGIAPIPEGAFFTCSLCQEGLPDFYYGAILHRDDAPPGEGAYELVFFAPPGPYFYGISALSYGDGENGVAVGYLTSVLCEGGVCYEEIVKGDLGTPFAVSALAPGDYWMLAITESGGNILARHKK
jgi:hypothetical protein